MPIAKTTNQKPLKVKTIIGRATVKVNLGSYESAEFSWQEEIESTPDTEHADSGQLRELIRERLMEIGAEFLEGRKLGKDPGPVCLSFREGGS